MALTHVGTATDNAFNGTDPAIDVSGLSLQEDDILVVIAAVGHGSADTPSFATSGDSSGAFTQEAESTHTASTNGVTVEVSYQVMGATPDATITCALTGSDTDMGAGAIAVAYRGGDTTTQMDAAATSATGSSSQPDSPSITTVTDGAFVISGVAVAGSSDVLVDPPTGYGNETNEAAPETTASISVSFADLAKATAGAEDPGAWSNYESGAARPWIAYSIAIRPMLMSSVVLRRRIEGY